MEALVTQSPPFGAGTPENHLIGAPASEFHLAMKGDKRMSGREAKTQATTAAVSEVLLKDGEEIPDRFRLVVDCMVVDPKPGQPRRFIAVASLARFARRSVIIEDDQ
jgi:hypothetical protein